MKRLINSVFCTALFAVSLSVSQSSLAEEITKTRAMTEFGEPLYKDNFEHWPSSTRMRRRAVPWCWGLSAALTA